MLWLLSAALLLCGCGSAGEGAMNGGFFGHVIGSAIGGLTGGWRGEHIGALAGTVGGAVAGAAIGAAVENKHKKAWEEQVETERSRIAVSIGWSGSSTCRELPSGSRISP